MTLDEDFHGLELDGPWLKALIADFAHSTHSPTRRDALRPKDWLHLSLAYGFPPERHGPLARPARELVDISASVQWELRFYEWHVDGAWQAHARARSYACAFACAYWRAKRLPPAPDLWCTSSTQ